MSSNPLVFVDHILENIENIEQFSKKLTKDAIVNVRGLSIQ